MKQRVVIITTALLLIAGGLAAAAFSGLLDLTPERQPAPFPTPAETRDGRWQQDITYLADNLTTLHVNAFHTISEADFSAVVTDLTARIPELRDDQILTELARLVALVGDGHTALNLFTPGVIERYPLQLTLVENRVIVVGAQDAQRDLIGGELLQIDNTPIADALVAIEALIARDNAQQVRQQQPLFLTFAELLTGLSIVLDRDAATFTVRDLNGEVQTATLSPLPLDTEIVYISLYNALALDAPVSVTERAAYYGYTFLPDSGTLYFQYNRCADDPDLPFADFNAEMFAFIDANPIERIVIDLRYNGGGNSAIIRPFLRELRARPDLNREGHVYALIGSRTFSSALMNAVDLRDDTAALLVGEPTGGAPNHYGEVRSFTLPNSGLRVSYSTRFWNLLPEITSPALEPDIAIVPTLEDVLTGRDVVLENVINLPASQ